MTDAKRYQVISAITDIKGSLKKPDIETQLLLGEIFVAEAEESDWIRGHCEHDGSIGFVAKKDLSEEIYQPTHSINVAHTISYSSNEIEAVIVNNLSFASLVAVVKTDEGRYGEHMSQISTGEWVMSAHISPIDAIEEDFVATAQKFLHTPYRWGGRSGLGIDCSALVQLSLASAGIKVPRNSGRILGTMKQDVEIAQKGDIVFFKGHVGIMIDNLNIIHAAGDKPRGGSGNKTSMITRIEPLKELAKSYEDGIKAIKRL